MAALQNVAEREMFEIYGVERCIARRQGNKSDILIGDICDVFQICYAWQFSSYSFIGD